jgi:integrative and conjugative element protein (TIGR02256 family)
VNTDDRAPAPQIRISRRALAQAEARAVSATPHELGGVLIGWWEGDDVAVVDDLLSVPDPRAGHTHYERHHSAAQRALEDYLQSTSDLNAGYIGEWHSHPAPQPPSAIDRGALTSIVRQVRQPVALVVLSVTEDGKVRPHGLIGRPRWPRRPRRATIEIALVETMSQ